MIFLRDQIVSQLADCDVVDSDSLSRRVVHRQRLMAALRMRFRSEYLGQLKWWFTGRNSRQVQVGDIELAANDQEKRIHWPLGRVVQLFPGKDGQVRLVKLPSEQGQLIRPILELYPLECTANFSGTQGDGVHKEEGVWSPFVKQPDEVA
ncbi:hypothetical protein HUJ04_011390 [Dendroctonus ponderosae]|nr:hypothetical protein HUJ04_011390 [Dendroctonus ponderosae]